MHKQPVSAILTNEERRAYRTLANAARRVQELAAKRKADNDARRDKKRKAVAHA